MKMTRFQSFVSLVLFLLLSASSHAKKNRDIPHQNSGLLTPYEPGPFGDLKLGNDDEKVLDAGKPVMKQTPSKDGEQGGGAICIQDVDAPKSAVWSQILGLDSYKGKVPKVNEAKNYFVKTNEDGTCTIKTKMTLGVIPGYSVSFGKC
jgi:hypothetical protein